MEEKTKEQLILEAAEYVFLEQGLEASKTIQIAEKAGVTHAMLHYYFRTKENLFDVVLGKKIREMTEALKPILENAELPFLERVEKGMRLHFDFLRENPKLPRFIINEVLYKDKYKDLRNTLVKNHLVPLFEPLQWIIDRECEKGNINYISAPNLLLNIGSLNVFVFAVMPIAQVFAELFYQNESEFFEARKNENVQLIMNRLKK
jgi:AcrR family transcriptional regulator